MKNQIKIKKIKILGFITIFKIKSYNLIEIKNQKKPKLTKSQKWEAIYEYLQNKDVK